MSGVGVVYVAYGRNYNYQAAFSARSLRAVSAAPICLFTNVEPEPEWRDITDVTTVAVDAPNEANRAIKTALYTHSPFERTLYLDADTRVLRGEVDSAFAVLDEYDLMAVPEREAVTSEKGLKVGVYWKVHCALGYRLPLQRFNGGVWFFRKTPAAALFFALWHACWQQMGLGRDMPALAWALQQCRKLRVKALRPSWNAQEITADTIIAHAWGAHRIAGIPNVTKYIPDMHGNPEWRKRTGDVDLETEAPDAR